MTVLADQYKKEKKYLKMEKYYLRAIQHGHVVAMNNLAFYYYNTQSYNKVKKYYKTAAKN